MRSRHSVEPASYGADLTRVLKRAVFCRVLVILVFVIVECGYPYTIGTNSSPPEPLGECVITLLEPFC
jgi:hypothetical protein